MQASCDIMWYYDFCQGSHWFVSTCNRQGSSRSGLPLSYMAPCSQGHHPRAQQFKRTWNFWFLRQMQISKVIACANGQSQIMSCLIFSLNLAEITHLFPLFDEVIPSWKQPWSFSCSLFSLSSPFAEFWHRPPPVDSSAHLPTFDTSHQINYKLI